MNSEDIKHLVREAGAVGAGIASAVPVDAQAVELYERRIAEGRHGAMGYLASYSDVRRDPRLLLEGAKSIIVAAFSYNAAGMDRPAGANEETGVNRANGANGANGADNLRWARYAVGRDYHEEVRERLARVATAITEATGALCRVTVDTAPLRERYWAQRAGVGFIGINNQLIVPGAGSWCVLGEIITTLDLEPDAPCTGSCRGCGRCVKACPGHALDGRGGMDARRCMSYLSIEYRGDDIPCLGDRIYGCDICQEVCPHNAGACTSQIAGFAPRESILSLTREDILEMRQEDFSRIFTHSAIKRTKLAGLQRNARHLNQGGREATQPE